MNLTPALFAILALILAILVLRRPAWLFFVWPILLLVFPTTRTLLGGAPFYWYDAATLALLARLYLSGELKTWPAGVPAWHAWFIGVALLFGTIVPLVRYAAGLEMFWIFGHAALAWLAFPIGIAMSVSPNATAYRRCITLGLVLSLVLYAVIAVLQFGNEGLAQAINGFFYRDMEGHLVRLEEVGATLSASRANGPFGDSNTFGGTTAIVCAVCLLLTRSSAKGLVLIAAVAGAVVIGCTVSRQVLVAATLGILVLLALGTAGGRLRVVGMIVLLAGVVLASGVTERWGARLAKWEGGVTQDENVLGRVVYGPQRMAALIAYDPSVLIVGAGLDVQKLRKKAQAPDEKLALYNMGAVSNGFLLPLYYMGICGFVLTLWFWFWVLRRALARPPADRAIATACVVGAMVLIAADNYAAAVEATISMLSLLAALVGAGTVVASSSAVPVEYEARAVAGRRFPNLVS